jgi:hypothetical protein
MSALVGGALVLGLLSGCAGMRKTVSHPVEPPYIPDPPSISGTLVPVELPSVSENIRNYADLLHLDEDSPYLPRLQSAVAHAITLGVLKPGSPTEKFDPERPVTYGEFRSWTLAYQSAVSGIGMMPTEGASLSDVEEMTALKTQVAAGASPDLAKIRERIKILPDKLGWGGHALVAANPLSREEFCALAAYLNGRDQEATALDKKKIDAMAPGGDGSTPDEAFRSFTDYAKVSAWAKPFVAMAYRDGFLRQAFALMPNTLTIEPGFQPQKAVTRRQAMLLLDDLYGVMKPASEVLLPATDSAATNVGSPTTNQAATAPASESPNPISKLQRSRVVTPNGTRESLQISGPD